jgi:hypothetical protein
MDAAAVVRFDYLRGERQVSLRMTGLFLRRLKKTANALLAMAALVALPACAQYPGQVAKPGKDTPELRAVAVLEWTGDEQHPKASRIVPVSVFDGHELQDGGIYLSRPEPLALEGEVEYELKQDGRNTGLFVIQNSAREQGSWVGYGTWKPLAKPKPPAQLASVQSWKDDDANSDGPVLHRKAHSGDASSGGGSGSGGSSSGNQGPPPDPDRPTLHRSDSSDSSSSKGSGNSNPADTSTSSTSSSPASGPNPDPDRPTLHRSTSDDSAGNTASSGGNSPSSDPDRPKLKKKTQQDESYVSSLADSTDSDRPRLKRGKSADSGGAVLPSLMGLPPDMQQAVAVADAKDPPEHPWDYSWASPDDEAKMKASLEDMARDALGLNPPPAQTAPAPKKASTHKTRPAAPPPPAPLLDEQYRVFALTYGSGATLVLSAHTAGTGAQEKFVTLVAQPDLYGNVKVLFKCVTDAAHLDSTPRMRLVDAVDAMADNRGELLFELRGATQRQFALYRVLRGQATQLFVGGGGEIAGLINK